VAKDRTKNGRAEKKDASVAQAQALADAVPEFTLVPNEKPEMHDLGAPPTETRWNADKHTAVVQASLAFRLIWVLVGVLVAGGALFSTTKWTGLLPKDVTGFFGIAFGAVVTLATAATSFWFGTQKGRSGGSGP